MLEVERFAEIRAEIERTADRDRVLREAGISPREWIRIQRHWLGVLAAEAAVGKKGIAERYVRAFEGGSEPAVSTPAAEAPAVKSPVAVPSYLADARDGRQPLPSAAAAPPAPSLHVPSQFSDPAAPVAVALPEIAPSAAPQRRVVTLAGQSGAQGPATPFREAAPGERPAVAEPSPTPAVHVGTGTAMSFAVPSKLPLPFQRDKDSAAPSVAASASSSPAASPPAAASSPPSPSSPPPAATPPAASPPAAPPPAAGPAIAETALDLGLAKIVAAIPFKSSSTPKPSTPAPESPARSTSAPPPAAAAAKPPAAAPLPEITVEQYAWLVAALRRARGPADIEQALRALGLTPDAQRPLEERWRARMAADPALQQRFIAALSKYLPGGAR